MWYIKEDNRPEDVAVDVVIIFSRPWIAMLALGGVGHRMHLPFLFIDYWTVFLAVLALRMVTSQNHTSKFKAAQSRKGLR